MPVASPCTNVCVIDRRSGWCNGCARSIDEIMRWPLANEAERAAIVDQLPARRDALAQRKRPWFA